MDERGSNKKGKQRSKFKSKNKTVECYCLQKIQHIGKNCPKQKGKERDDKSFNTASVAKDKSDFDADSALSVLQIVFVRRMDGFLIPIVLIMCHSR